MFVLPLFRGLSGLGLMFLLSAQEQRRLIGHFAKILVPDGRSLFTSPALAGEWIDASTSIKSASLGSEKYRGLLKAVGISIRDEYENEVGNHYYEAVKDWTGEDG